MGIRVTPDATSNYRLGLVVYADRDKERPEHDASASRPSLGGADLRRGLLLQGSDIYEILRSRRVRCWRSSASLSLLLPELGWAYQSVLDRQPQKYKRLQLKTEIRSS